MREQRAEQIPAISKKRIKKDPKNQKNLKPLVFRASAYQRSIIIEVVIITGL